MGRSRVIQNIATPRSRLEKPYEGFPAYGAVHDVLPNSHLREFFVAFAKISDSVFDSPFRDDRLIIDNRLEHEANSMDLADEDVDQETKPYDSREYYRIFDPESLGVSVVEMDPSATQAKAFRSIWERQDFGAVEKEACNEIARIAGSKPSLFFDRVQGVGRRLPGNGRGEVRAKLALIPDTTRFNETLELIDCEAEVVINAIKRRLKQFIYPWDIMPHATFAVFKKSSSPEQVREIITGTNELLRTQSFGVGLGDLTFRHKALRKSR